MNHIRLKTTWSPQRPVPGQLLRRYTEEGDGPGIRYWRMGQDHELWRLILPDRRARWSMSLMTIDTSIPPHTDSGARTVINCYGATAEAITQFHQQRQQTVTQRQVRNQTTGHLYDARELVVRSQFCARPGEIWMLAVDQIHSVTTHSAQERWAICLSTDQPMSRAVLDLA